YWHQPFDERRRRPADWRRLPRYLRCNLARCEGKMSNGKNRLPAEARSAEVDQFLENLKKAPVVQPGGGRGRLIFAVDATASREPTWDRACRIQGEMFEATAALGGLEIQLVYYRGFSECKTSKWLTTAADLHRVMRSVFCVGGETQIERVLN